LSFVLSGILFECFRTTLHPWSFARMVWRLSNRHGHKISGPSERVPLPISEGLTRIRFALIDTLFDFSICSH
jgi:hypothetical protein